MLLKKIPRLDAIPRQVDLVAFIAQNDLEDATHFLLVIHD